jgi:hypothetical protein
MKGMDKRILDLDLDTKTFSHISRYASVSKLGKKVKRAHVKIRLKYEIVHFRTTKLDD